LLSHSRPARLLPPRYFQPFATPDAFDSVFAYLPAGSIEQRRDPAITIAAIRAGKYNDGLSQSIFVFTLRRPVALRASGLPQQKARMPLNDSMLTGMADRTVPSFRLRSNEMVRSGSTRSTLYSSRRSKKTMKKQLPKGPYSGSISATKAQESG
jgi:hypothetical protein